MSDLAAARVFLQQRLSEHDGLIELVEDRIYADQAPQEDGEGEPLPVVVYALNSASDRLRPGADGRIWSRPRYLVKGIVSGADYALAGRIAAQIDQALTGAAGTVTVDGQQYYVQRCYREQPVQYPETEDGRRYVHEGGLYRMLIYAVPAAEGDEE